MGRPFSFVLVAITVVSSLALQAWRMGHVVEAEAWDALAERVRVEHRAGDLIVVSPWFIVEPRARLGDLPLREPRDLHPDDLVGFQRVTLIEVDALGADSRTRWALEQLGTAAESFALDGVEVTRFAIADPPRVLFDLGDDLRRARVRALYPEGGAGCDRWDRDRWVCPRNSDWSYVGRRIIDAGDEPRECVWMHPLPDRAPLRVELPAGAGTLYLGAGFTQHGARSAAAPVRLTVHEGERPVHELIAQVEGGWHRARAPLRGDGPVVLQVETTNNGASHFCVSATVVAP